MTDIVVPTVGTPEGNPAPSNISSTVPPIPQPKEPVAPVETTVSTANFNSGNAALDAAVNSVAKVAGATDADIQRAIGVALERGDVTLIDNAFITEKFGSNAATFSTIAETLVTEAKTAAAQYNATVEAAIKEVAGDRTTWDKHADAFKATAPAHIQAAARAMLDSGFVKEGMQFVLSHTNGNVVPNTGNLIGGIPSGQPTGLSADEFRAEQSKLMKEAGNRSLESGDYNNRLQALIKQRQIGKANGR